MALLSNELIFVLLNIVVIMKFQLHKFFITWLLKNTKIFLPPTEKDYELILEIRKDKSKNVQGDAIVRTCSINEYINGIKDDNFSQSDLVVFFYLTSFINLLFLEGTKCFNYLSKNFFTDIEIQENQQEIKFNNENMINVGASFVFITITYLFYSSFKITFKTGFKSYEARIFYLIFVLFFVLNFVSLSYFDGLFNFNHDTICEIVNLKFELILQQTENNSNFNICNKNILNTFYSLIFAFSTALIYRSSIRLSTCDDMLINATEKAESIFREAEDKKNSGQTKRIQFICKTKQLINALILILMIDPLLKNYIVENSLLSEVFFNFIFILPMIFIEFILNLYCMQFYSSLFLNQNYYEMIDFCKNPDIKLINNVRIKMEFLNTKFWEIFSNLFNIMFSSLITFLFYINRSDVLSGMLGKSNFNEFKFKTNFIETLVFFCLLSITFAKAVFGNMNAFYLKKFNSDRKIIFF